MFHTPSSIIFKREVIVKRLSERCSGNMADFEVLDRDLLARIGRLKTRSGTIETPAFLPVINPVKEAVTPKELWENYGCKILMTNAYIIKKHFNEGARELGVHRLLGFPGAIMTDSGAYQILEYGEVGATNEEIIRYQEDIGSDIAVILDLPTGWNVTWDYAKYTVEETLRRARELWSIKSRGDIMWVGPVQGGRYVDLVALSAREIGSLPFDIHALGSPTPIMEQYLFHILVDMILTAKMNLPVERPFHLFGAGHPFMFSLVVALGCDLFDSAAYSIFAREDRYITEYGTIRLEDLEYAPCSCPVCVKRSPRELREMPKTERETEISRHNLYVCFAEIRRIKQAILEGRLWEYIEMRAHSHPALLQALKKLERYSDYVERVTPVVKRRGLFFFNSPLDFIRPETTRYERRLLERYTPPKRATTLLLIPDSETKDNRRRRYLKKVISLVCKRYGLDPGSVHVCFCSPPFGVIPVELSEIYPLYQYEYAYPPNDEVIERVAEKVLRYVLITPYERVIMLVREDSWSQRLADSCTKLFSERLLGKNILIFNI
ncbi:MAG: tRNA guanosine(15) transglycosylase TgtA [Candidatus Bathyarchaeia archaeon]